MSSVRCHPCDREVAVPLDGLVSALKGTRWQVENVFCATVQCPTCGRRLHYSPPPPPPPEEVPASE